MKKILIFAGTTEGRRLTLCLQEAGIPHTVCVATPYGELLIREHPMTEIRTGRMDYEKMQELMEGDDFAAVVDATHPYATKASENIRKASAGAALPCLRLKRETSGEGEAGALVRYFATEEECAGALLKTEGNILFTCGSKTLAGYCGKKELRDRLYVRVLPDGETIALCRSLGIKGKRILALQGPFTEQMNEAMIGQYGIKYLVTRNSGEVGGYQQKLRAAARSGVPVFAVGAPPREQGDSFAQVCRRLEGICGRPIRRPDVMEILLVGAGMGTEGQLTGEAARLVEEADILLGSPRLIAPYRPRVDKQPLYRPEQVIPYLKEMHQRLSPGSLTVVVLFSGDTGFYSGCRELLQALREEIGRGELLAVLRVLPGISSVSCLAACVGESYEDAPVYSIHGRKLPDLAGRLKYQEKAFVLLSGAEDLRRLGKMLLAAGMDRCEVLTGYQMSYPNQQIRRLSPAECAEVKEEGLYTCMVKNPEAEKRFLTHGIGDGEFIRDSVPMTKEEVREAAVCKLRLYQGAVVYDIGSGTGSVAVEMALLSPDVQVFAVEQRQEAIRLIEKNRDKFGAANLFVVPGSAPEGLTGLPAATHCFIGGNGGRLGEILAFLYGLGTPVRVVISAVSLETLWGIQEKLSLYPVEHLEITQISVSRAKEAGKYHLMRAENPVWLWAFELCGRKEGV